MKKYFGEQGFEAEDQIYEVAQEYDGREVLIVKPSIQFRVAHAGILQNDKPAYSNIDKILENAPTHTGIWIEENSREKILNLLKNITKSTYKINKEGYLIQEEKGFVNNYDKKINNMLSSNNLYVFSINSICYIVDEVIGVIQEYPFEEMDPYQGFQNFESDNKEIFMISENNMGKVNQEEVIKEILDSVK